jgi:DNA-binding transcriptional regulator YhcF (GntR family)
MPDPAAPHASLLDTLAARVQAADGLPPYLQLRGAVTGAIADGVLRPGDALPPVRAVAAALGLAPNTVAKTYALLREDGLTENRAGAGTRVRADLSTGPQAQLQDLRDLLGQLRASGVPAEQLRAVLDEVLLDPAAG